MHAGQNDHFVGNLSLTAQERKAIQFSFSYNAKNKQDKEPMNGGNWF